MCKQENINYQEIFERAPKVLCFSKKDINKDNFPFYNVEQLYKWSDECEETIKRDKYKEIWIIEKDFSYSEVMKMKRLPCDKIVLKRLEEIINEYSVTTIVIGMPINMNGTKTERAEVTEKFIHKMKCKFGKIPIERIDERLTTVEAHKTMNFLNINKYKKRNIVDTISPLYYTRDGGKKQPYFIFR